MSLRVVALTAFVLEIPVLSAVAAQQPASDVSTAIPDSGATRAERLIVQGIAGAAGGAIGALALGAAGAAVIGPHGGEDPGLLGAVLGGLAGLTLGIGGGVSLTARWQGEPSSFAGAAIGAAGGVLLVAALAQPLHLDTDYAALWICLATIPPAAAVLGNRGLGSAHRPMSRLVIGPLRRERVGLGMALPL
jgi:hypothetical protein